MIKILSSASGRRLAQGSLLALGLQLAASGSAWAQSAPVCNACLVSVSSSTAFLKANCTIAITGIGWQRTTGSPPVTTSLTGGADLPIGNLAASANGCNSADAVTYFNAPLLSGVNTFTATSGTAIAGTAVTIVTPPPQTVTGVASPPGSGTVNCVSPVANGGSTTCAINPTSGYALTGASSDTCGGSLSGNNFTTGSVVTACTVTATFAQVVASACGSANGVATASTPPPPNTTLCAPNNQASAVSGPSNNTYSWTCTGQYSTSAVNCSAPQIVPGVCGSANGSTPLAAAPTGAAACSAGNSTTPVATTSSPFNWTWTCNGINSTTSPSCSAPQTPTNAVCGSAQGQTVASTPTGTAACSQGTLAATPTLTSGQYAWTCNGLAGGQPASCTAFSAAPAINGVCGLADGGSFTSAPTINLCTSGTPTAISGTGPWTWQCIGSGGGTNSRTCQANLSGTTPPPPGGSCGMQTGDLTWSNFKAVQLWPVPAVRGSGDSGRAVEFIADATAYPRGVILTITDESQPTSVKEYVISSCAHNFTPVGGQAGCLGTGFSTSGGIALRFGPASDGSCSLSPGGTYYINFRDYFTPRGTVSSQFVIYNRLD